MRSNSMQPPEIQTSEICFATPLTVFLGGFEPAAPVFAGSHTNNYRLWCTGGCSLTTVIQKPVSGRKFHLFLRTIDYKPSQTGRHSNLISEICLKSQD